jgi:hypothetical protein
MKFEERDDGDYRIYAGAFEAAVGGFYASVVIVRVRGAGAARAAEAYRAEMLDDARAFNREDVALSYALAHGSSVIRTRPAMLAC